MVGYRAVKENHNHPDIENIRPGVFRADGSKTTPERTQQLHKNSHNRLGVEIMDIKIQQLLYSIGLTANYAGFRQMMIALEIATQEPESLRLVTKWLYPETARRCGTNWKTVERNIRTMLGCAWKNSQDTLEQMAGCALDTKPKPAQFIAILVYGLSNVH